MNRATSLPADSRTQKRVSFIVHFTRERPPTSRVILSGLKSRTRLFTGRESTWTSLSVKFIRLLTSIVFIVVNRSTLKIPDRRTLDSPSGSPLHPLWSETHHAANYFYDNILTSPFSTLTPFFLILTYIHTYSSPRINLSERCLPRF